MENKQVVAPEVTWELLLDQVEEEPNEVENFLDRCHVLELTGEEIPQMGGFVDDKENLIIGVDLSKHYSSTNILVTGHRHGKQALIDRMEKQYQEVANAFGIDVNVLHAIPAPEHKKLLEGQWYDFQHDIDGQPVSEFYSGQCTPSRDNALSGFGDTRSRNTYTEPMTIQKLWCD